MSAHADAAELVDYARGQLSSERSQQLRHHCSECLECGDRLAAVLLLRQARELQRPRGHSDRRLAVLAAAATMAALALALWATMPRAGRAAQDAASGVVGDLQHMRQPLALVLWAAQAQVGAAPATQGGAAGPGELTPALSSLRAGDFDRAASIVAGIDDSPLARLLLGIAWLHGGQADAARAPLAAAVAGLAGLPEQGALAQAARLYLAEALLQSGETAAARRQLAELAQVTGERDAFEDAAAARLEALDAAAAAR